VPLPCLQVPPLTFSLSRGRSCSHWVVAVQYQPWFCWHNNRLSGGYDHHIASNRPHYLFCGRRFPSSRFLSTPDPGDSTGSLSLSGISALGSFLSQTFLSTESPSRSLLGHLGLCQSPSRCSGCPFCFPPLFLTSRLLGIFPAPSTFLPAALLDRSPAGSAHQ
jgi:hypothetical protein